MSVSVFGDGFLYTEYPVQESIIDPKNAFQRVIVDGGHIELDHAAHTDKDTHLYLKGPLASHESFIKITSGGAELLKVDHTGFLSCPIGIGCPELTSLLSITSSLNTLVTTNATAITAAQSSESSGVYTEVGS